MGWEYHNRHRNTDGSFAAYKHRRTAQIHVRCTPFQRDMIRARALARQQDMNEYILELIRKDLLLTVYGEKMDTHGSNGGQILDISRPGMI